MICLTASNVLLTEGLYGCSAVKIFPLFKSLWWQLYCSQLNFLAWEHAQPLKIHVMRIST